MGERPCAPMGLYELLALSHVRAPLPLLRSPPLWYRPVYHQCQCQCGCCGLPRIGGCGHKNQCWCMQWGKQHVDTLHIPLYNARRACRLLFSHWLHAITRRNGASAAVGSRQRERRGVVRGERICPLACTRRGGKIDVAMVDRTAPAASAKAWDAARGCGSVFDVWILLYDLLFQVESGTEDGG